MRGILLDRAIFILALIGSSACGGAPPPAAKSEPPSVVSGRPAPPVYVLEDDEIERVIRDVSAARQLPPNRTVTVVRLGREAFVERLLGRSRDEPRAPGLSAESAFLVGFDFLPAPSKRAEIATMDEVLKEQVVGFYDHAADTIFVPKAPAPTEQKLLEQRAVLAHEVQHALVAQRFAALPEPTSSDEAIAQRSLHEGDAMVAMGALLGAEAGAPVGRTLRRLAIVTERVPLASVTGAEQAKSIDRALDITRKRLLFPYEEGMLFVSDIYRAGGFPLVDRLYEHPPKSTAQILHPDKYLGGVAPRPIRDPELYGYRAATIDTMGELGVRVLLGRCLDQELATRAADGWAGDRFGVFASPTKALAVAWVSAWDTERDAEEMEAALQQSARCWGDNAVGLAQGDYAIGGAFRVTRQGKIVTFVRGVPDREAPGVAQQLRSLVGPAPTPARLTDLVIPPRVSLPEPRPGKILGGVYQNEWLGVAGRVPPGMRATVDEDQVDFRVERPDAQTYGVFSLTTRVVNAEQNDKTFRELEADFVKEARRFNGQVLAYPERSVRTSLGAGTERTWGIRGDRTQYRAVLIPICAGTGSIAFVQLYRDGYGRKVLDGWMESFRWARGRNVIACDFLDPK